MKPLFSNRKSTTVIGVMSGTSLDGLDIAVCNFIFENNKWAFEILKSDTIKYDSNWIKYLGTAHKLSATDLISLHNKYGRFIGLEINKFIYKLGQPVDLIASHGHTVFHQPERGITFQVGNGTTIAEVTGIPTISDFRTTDVGLGGQGAPLVPIGDKLLFSDYDFCLNLGGFANISFEKDEKRIAYDICPVNIVLNLFAEKKGLLFDKDGLLGKTGIINDGLYKELNRLNYYLTDPPKSLGREWVEKYFLPLLKKSDLNFDDKIRTVYEHIAFQLGNSLHPKRKVLITGGGSFNTFLIDRIKKYTKSEIVLPPPQLIDYKEALIFAFLGLLKTRGEVNCLASVTGAVKDSSCGVIYIP
ncbi:MAG: anhydro-N-acetylmuramic acid kinase [Mariniphaga sp.]|nr:anhydro-N-acetylmuramic acid kinase [Mariniphaga sp.]